MTPPISSSSHDSGGGVAGPGLPSGRYPVVEFSRQPRGVGMSSVTEFRKWEEEEALLKPTKPLAYEVVKRFANACEQIAVLEKLCEGRLDLGYLEWNGVTRR
jgi:DNA gyrase inhibitor GyrI